MTKGWRSRAVGHVKVESAPWPPGQVLLYLSCGHTARLGYRALVARRGKKKIVGCWGRCRVCVSDARRSENTPRASRTAPRYLERPDSRLRAPGGHFASEEP